MASHAQPKRLLGWMHRHPSAAEASAAVLEAPHPRSAEVERPDPPHAGPLDRPVEVRGWRY